MIGLFLFYCLVRFRPAAVRIVPRMLSISVLALIVLSTGCRTEEAHSVSQLEQPTPPKVPAAARPAPIHSVAPETQISDSPAANSLSSDPASESPESVCRAFVQRLQNRDRIGAENLLTRAALTTTHRANLELEPVSSQDAMVTVHPARYENQLERTAQVDCEIVDSADGDAAPISLTWQVVRQSSGWRVCGMLVPVDEGEQMQLLSFESIDDVATIKLLAAGDAMAESEENLKLRQAEANEPNTSLQ